MAATRLHNIDGSTGPGSVELIAPGESVRINSILFTNSASSADAVFTLFIQDDPASGTKATSTFTILSNITIPPGASLLLDNPSMINFSEKFGLYCSPSATTTLDVFIN